MAETFALHQARGQFSTPSRTYDWLTRMGVSEDEQLTFPQGTGDQQEWLARHKLGHGDLVWLQGTSCDIARDTFRDAKISQGTLRRARIIYHETEEAYPLGCEHVLVDLSEQFNDIKDADLINDLQKSIVARVDDATVGLALAQEVKRTIVAIRNKDRLAANIALVATMYDTALAGQEKAHGLLSAIEDDQTRQTIVTLLRLHNQGETDLWSHLSEGERRIAAEFFEVSPSEDINALLQTYFKAAEDSIFVAE